MSNNRVKITDLNKSGKFVFSNLFENIVEHYPKISQHLYEEKPFKNTKEILKNALDFLDHLSSEEKEKILKLYPDLAGKIALQGKLTEESKKEHRKAGLDVLSHGEIKKLTKLNKLYREKFDFPFVICARENNYASIKTKLEERLQNSKETEIQIGFEEVKKITKLRLKDLITE